MQDDLAIDLKYILFRIRTFYLKIQQSIKYKIFKVHRLFKYRTKEMFYILKICFVLIFLLIIYPLSLILKLFFLIYFNFKYL